MKNDTKTESTVPGHDQIHLLPGEFLTRICDTLCRLAELSGSMSDEPDRDRRVAKIKEMSAVADPLFRDAQRLLEQRETDDGPHDDSIPPEWIRDKVGRLAALAYTLDRPRDAEHRHAIWRDMHKTAGTLAVLMEEGCGCGELLCESLDDPDCAFAKLAAELFGNRGNRGEAPVIVAMPSRDESGGGAA